MPIKNLTDQRRLPRLGKIHLGIMAETKSGVKHPKAVDYFVFPKENERQGYEYYDSLVKLFGEKPRMLRIMLPVEDSAQWAQQWYKCYSKTRGLICKGDGENAWRTFDTETGDLADRNSKDTGRREVACQGRECPDYQAKKCKEMMNLQFLLPEIPGMGVWQIDTSSVNAIRNINSSAEFIRAIYGRVSMIPLLLSIERIEVVNPDDGKKKKVWVMKLGTNNTLLDVAKAAARFDRLLTGPVSLPIDDEKPDEGTMLVTPDWENGEVDKPVVDADKLWPEAVPKEEARPGTEEAKPAKVKPVTDEGDLTLTTTDGVKIRLEDAVEQLRWKLPTIKSYLKTRYKIDTEGDLGEIVGRLSEDQRAEFAQEIKERMSML